MTPEAQAASDLAAALKDAHGRLRSLDAGDGVKQALARRLVAVSDAAKHDVGRAARRLAPVLADLDAARRASPPRPGGCAGADGEARRP